MHSAKKGSVPALVFLFDTGIKWPLINYTDLPDDESQRLGQRLISLAESAPVTKKTLRFSLKQHSCLSTVHIRQKPLTCTSKPGRQVRRGQRQGWPTYMTKS